MTGAAKTDARPKSRYVWWAFLSAIAQRTWASDAKIIDGDLLQQEVTKGTRFWGTHGKYVKRNMLLAFAKEIIRDDVSSTAESIMEHTMDEKEGETLVEDDTAIEVLKRKRPSFAGRS